jgi:hypothetical protein
LDLGQRIVQTQQGRVPPGLFVKAHTASALFDCPKCTDMLKREKYPNTGQETELNSPLCS